MNLTRKIALCEMVTFYHGIEFSIIIILSPYPFLVFSCVFFFSICLDNFFIYTNLIFDLIC